jgi:hypothetical protein
MSISPKKTKKTKKKPKSVRHGDWVQKLDPNSKRYYYGNVKTLERVWEMPEEFKLAAEAVAASSKTNALSSSSSNSPSSSSTTTNVTSPIADTTESISADIWIEGYDPKNKRKYYVNKLTGESRWTKPLDKNEVKAEDWISGRDPKTKRVYYYNKRTKETTWEKPPGYQEPGSKEKAGAHTEDAKKIISEVNAKKTAPTKMSIQPKDVTSDSPSLKSLKEKSTLNKRKKRSPPEAGKSGTMLWISGNDPETGKVYYYNTTTKETTWTNPTDTHSTNTTSEKRLSETMLDVDKIVKTGIVKERRSSIIQPKQSLTNNSTASEAEELIRKSKQNKLAAENVRKAGNHLRQRSTADEAQKLIRLGKEMKALEDARAAKAAAAEGTHDRKDSTTEDLIFSDLIMTSPTLDNVPGINNVVEVNYFKLLSENENNLRVFLLNHRKHIGGLSTAPLSDIIDALGNDGGDGLTPYMDADGTGHVRSVSHLSL